MIASIESARTAAGLSQRELADRAGRSQPTVQRILTGRRPAKTPEIILIADAVGCTLAQLTGNAVADRVQCAARSTNGEDMDATRQRLLHYMEIDAYLDGPAIPAPRWPARSSRPGRPLRRSGSSIAWEFSLLETSWH